ncbi:MAG: LysE family transporter [Clostridium sp.]|nr:LysE family transporter [Bacteroides sp.]MCM1199266.1 LysE family transporter [Clostridium sp.]
MQISLLPSLLISIFLVGYTPGPANLYAFSCAIRFGRRKAMKMWLGIFVGFVLTASVVAVLMHFLGEVMGDYVRYLKYIGSAYLLYLAWTFLRARRQDSSEPAECSFISGMLVPPANAKMILFEMSVMSSFVLPYSDRLADLLAVAALLILAGPVANMVWLLAGNLIRPLAMKYSKATDLTIAILLACCAVYMAA